MPRQIEAHRCAVTHFRIDADLAAGLAHEAVDHDHPDPDRMRIVAQHDHADAGKGRERGEEGAHCAEQFRRVYLPDPTAVRGLRFFIRVEGQRRGIYAEIKTDGAGQHHQQQEGLVGERGMAGAHQRRYKQAARRAGHCKPNAFQDVGEFSNAGSHGGTR